MFLHHCWTLSCKTSALIWAGWDSWAAGDWGLPKVEVEPCPPSSGGDEAVGGDGMALHLGWLAEVTQACSGPIWSRSSMVEAQVSQVPRAGMEQLGGDPFLSPSPVFQEFIKMTNHDVEHAIRKRMSGDVRDAFVAIGQCLAGAPLGQGSPEGKQPLSLPLPRQCDGRFLLPSGHADSKCGVRSGCYRPSYGAELAPLYQGGFAADPMGGTAPC